MKTQEIINKNIKENISSEKGTKEWENHELASLKEEFDTYCSLNNILKRCKTREDVESIKMPNWGLFLKLAEGKLEAIFNGTQIGSKIYSLWETFEKFIRVKSFEEAIKLETKVDKSIKKVADLTSKVFNPHKKNNFLQLSKEETQVVSTMRDPKGPPARVNKVIKLINNKIKGASRDPKQTKCKYGIKCFARTCKRNHNCIKDNCNCNMVHEMQERVLKEKDQIPCRFRSKCNNSGCKFLHEAPKKDKVGFQKEKLLKDLVKLGISKEEILLNLGNPNQQ